MKNLRENSWSSLNPRDLHDINKIYSSLLQDFKLFSYGSYSRRTADCAETVILNLINYLIWDDTNKKLRYDWLPENTIQPIKDFFNKNKDIQNINSIQKQKFNELLYGFEFILQNTDYCIGSNSNYKVYSQFEIKDSVQLIADKSASIAEYIFDQDGNILPGKKATKYSGWRIRPGYISFVRLFNIIFGYEKVNNKYQEKLVMRNVTMDSLKEILLTFRNPKITNILSNYKVTKGTSYYDEIAIKINNDNVEINLDWWHGTIVINGIGESTIDDTWIQILNDYYLRYYIDTTFNPIKFIENKPSQMLLLDPDILRDKLENRFLECMKLDMAISDEIIKVYKIIWAPEQKYIELKELPSDTYLNKFPLLTNNFFSEFKGKIKLSETIFENNELILNEDKMNLIIELNDGNINAELNKYGSKLINILIINQQFDLFEIAIIKGADYKVVDLFGNNILHSCKYFNNGSAANTIFKITEINRILKKTTGNDDEFNKLVMTKNSSGYYPIVDLYRKIKFIDNLLFTNDPKNILLLLENAITKMFITKQKAFLKILEKGIEIISSSSTQLAKDVIRFFISQSIKNEISIRDYLILMRNSGIFDESEIDYVNQINYYQLREPKQLEFNIDTISQILEISKNYVQNPWVLFKNLNTSTINFNNLAKILRLNSKLGEFSKLGQIEDSSDKGLVDEITDWASKARNIPEILQNIDSDGNTIYHYLAIGSRINLDKSNQYIKVFKSLIDKNMFELLTAKNKNGWSPIDILSYIPMYPNRVFLNNLDGIRDLFKILIYFYTKYSGDMNGHKIILTRYLITNYYVNIDQHVSLHKYKTAGPNKVKIHIETVTENKIKNLKEVEDLTNILNQKLTSYPGATADMLCKINKEFYLHEYLYVLGKTAYAKIRYVLNKYHFRNYYYSEVDGKIQTNKHEFSRLFNLSNKSTLNYVPATQIVTLPVLSQEKFNSLGTPHDLLQSVRKDTSMFVKSKIGEEISLEKHIDPDVEKMDPSFEPVEKVDESQFVPMIGQEDLEDIDDILIEEPRAQVTTSTAKKYLVEYENTSPDYKYLYLKYKQKYIKLKTKLN